MLCYDIIVFLYTGENGYGKIQPSRIPAIFTSGKTKKAFVYLKQFPDQKKLILQYQERFEQNKFPVPCDNKKILCILNIFYSYYHRVFWEQLEEEKAKKKLIEQFFSLLSLSLPENLDEYSSDQLDEIVKVRSTLYCKHS